MGTQATLTDFSDYDDYYWKISTEDLNDPANGWRVRMELPLQNNMEGKVYSKKVDGFPVEWIHSDVIYKGVSMEVWLKTVSDMERMFKGHDQHTQPIEVMSRHTDGMPHEVYNRLSMGMFMSERDNLFKATWEKQDDGSMLVRFNSFLSDTKPTSNDCVRIRFFINQRVIETPEGLHCRTYQNIDMGGYIPTGLQNLVSGTTTKEYLCNGNKNL